MPQEAKTLRVDLLDAGPHDLVVQQQYEAPSDADGNPADDRHARMDMANARWMMDTLTREYPGVPWRVVHDGAQGMAYVSVPILMGINKFWAINLATDPLTDGLLKRCGGEILERYRLSRGRFDLGKFLDARAKHSALVMPGRPVPE